MYHLNFTPGILKCPFLSKPLTYLLTIGFLLNSSLWAGAQTNDITGQVFLDENLSGTLDGGDFPQSSVRVYLYEDVNQNAVLDGGDTYQSQDMTDADGDYSFSVSGPGGLSIRVSAGNDDAEERVSNGNVSLGSSDLELIKDGSNNQIVGIRFNNVTIPRGATILSAYLEFAADETDNGSTNLTIYGEDHDDASQYTGSNYDISNRTKTTASVNWNSVAAWNSIGQTHQSPDLTTIVQEIVDRSGWSSGNDMAFIIEGSGKRVAEAHNGSPASAPLLVIQYDDGSTIDYLVDVELADLSTGYTLTTSSTLSSSFSGSGAVDSLNNTGYDGKGVGCFAVADGGNQLYLINRFSGYNEVVGSNGVSDIEAIAVKTGGDIVYAADANKLGTLNRFTGSYTAKPSTFGTGSGVYGNINLTDVDGLAYDPTTSVLYGTHRRSGQDVLFQIDESTGAHVPDAFGLGIDYVPVTGPGFVADIDDIAVDPATGDMYGINNDGGFNDFLVSIDKNTGAGIVLATIGVDDMEGLGITNDGTIYGTTGSSSGGNSNKLFIIDKVTGAATEIAPFSSGSDFEACDCIMGPVSGLILPIELLQFTALLDNTAVKLDWITASEKDLDYFILERSANGNSFEEIGIVDGQGHSTVSSSYDHTDYQPLPGTSYYRLKILDVDGQFEYSEIQIVSNPGMSDEFNIFPNPATRKNALFLQYGGADTIAEIAVFDLSGRKIHQQGTFGESEGLYMIFDPSAVPEPGVYQVVIQSETHTHTRKLIIQ